MSFCTECGARKKQEWTGRFDAVTGEKSLREVCSAQPCTHNSHDWKLLGNGGFWKRLFSPDLRCARCGETSWFSGE